MSSPTRLALVATLALGVPFAASAHRDPLGGPVAAVEPSSAPSSATAAHLAAAYETDVHARVRYLAFAQQADAEGHPDAARVFRAAARSEQVRAGRHADALRALGGEPVAAPAPEVVTRGARQDLLWMLAHENAERGGTYPRYVQQARREGHAQAVLTFSEAHQVETALVKLYEEALAGLAARRSDPAPLHVCGDCGHVVRGSPPARCPISLSEGAAFVRVD